MQTLNDTLRGRVDDLIGTDHRARLLSTTGTQAAVEELIERNDRLEGVVRELADALERVSSRLKRRLGRLDETPNAYSVRLPSSP